MNESIRVSGKTVNDAIMNAAIALNTTVITSSTR